VSLIAEFQMLMRKKRERRLSTSSYPRPTTSLTGKPARLTAPGLGL
jgi:hypothetical protein